MGEKIATPNFPSGGDVGSILELSLGDQKLFAKYCDGMSSERFGVSVSNTDESQYIPAILVSENDPFCF